MTTEELSEIVKDFVAGTLGCGCPDSVFGQVDYDARSSTLGPDLPLQRLLVGNRLLIYILECNDAAALRKLLPQLIEKGKAERDRRGYNRLRVVVSTGQPELIRHEAEQLFSGVGGLDDKVHLHVLSGCCSLEVLRDWMTCVNSSRA